MEMEIQVDFESVSNYCVTASNNCECEKQTMQKPTQVSPQQIHVSSFPLRSDSSQRLPLAFHLQAINHLLEKTTERMEEFEFSLANFPSLFFPPREFSDFSNGGKIFSAGFSNPRNIENSLTFSPQANETQ
jgi:hypothetical protein